MARAKSRKTAVQTAPTEMEALPPGATEFEPEEYESAAHAMEASRARENGQHEFQGGHHHVENAERPKPPQHEQAEHHAQPRKPWQQRVGYWKNNDAGVRLEEDRKNKLSTIVSRDRLPDAALELLDERGWQEDPAAGGFSKKIDHLRAADSRDQALETVKDVANVVLAAKGLPELKSAFVSRS